ncbi:hypothetical protein [Actinocorallia longicatena]
MQARGDIETDLDEPQATGGCVLFAHAISEAGREGRRAFLEATEDLTSCPLPK